MQEHWSNEQLPSVIVIIPTKNRPEKLRRALESVEKQILQPWLTIIVNDGDENYRKLTREVIQMFADKIRIIFVNNKNTANLSGAINTGLIIARNTGHNPDKSFVALLDDDDWWDHEYLDKCFQFAAKKELDWVISGIVRYDKKTPSGAIQPIPGQLKPADFYITNPNIQGSNLFVKLAYLLRIDGFDEKLVSTTDRDTCIRLLETKSIRYGSLKKHLVHHWAFDTDERLSTPGSSSKKSGLTSFYKKYEEKMSDSQKREFKERAKILFNVSIE